MLSLAKKYQKNDNNLAIAYYRFSSHSQNEASIDQQKEAAERYAEGHGYHIIREYSDAAISGTTDERPGFQLMLSEIGKLRPAALILWKVDRLGRDRIDLAMAKKTIRDAGCSIHYVAEAIPTEAPEAALMEGLLESMAEFYSKQLSQNITRGMRYNAENGLYNGHKILGYKVDENKKYVIDKDTAPIVRKIFRDYVDGKPMVEIIKELNSQGVTTSRGGKFNINGLRSTLHQIAYTGVYKFGDVVIPGRMPVIISQELFDAAQKRMEQNKRQGSQRASGLEPDGTARFWLTGKLFCGECGNSMQGVSGSSHTGKTHYYYYCSGQRKHICHKKPVKKKQIESLVLHILSEFLKDSSNLASLAVDIAEYYKKTHEDTGYLATLEAEHDKTEKALSNLVKALEQGIFSETTGKRLEELEARKKALADAIQAEKAKNAMVHDDESIQSFFDQYKNADLSDPEIRDTVLDYFIDKIYVYDDRLVITCWYSYNHTEIEWSLVSEATEGAFDGSAPGSTKKSLLEPLSKSKVSGEDFFIAFRKASFPLIACIVPIVRQIWAL